MKVIVVGAGVIGASIAWNMARAGADVTVIDSGGPAASSTSFGWINASFYADAAHHRFRVAGIAAFRRMIAALPDLPIRMTGALWWEEQGTAMSRLQADLAALGYNVERLDRRQTAALEPDLRGLPEHVLRFSGEGAAEAGQLAHDLLVASGARLLSGVRAVGIAVQDGAVCGVETDAGRISADRVVVAAGTGSPAILQCVGVALPMLVRPGVLVTTKPVRARISHVLVSPYGEVRQLPDGRILASAVANHQGDDACEVAEQVEEIADRVLGWLKALIAGETLECACVAFANRPVPADGLPVIGAVGPRGLHVAVMHSGVTLAAIVGEAVAGEIIAQSAHDALLLPYRPQRFQ